MPSILYTPYANLMKAMEHKIPTHFEYSSYDDSTQSKVREAIKTHNGLYRCWTPQFGTCDAMLAGDGRSIAFFPVHLTA